MLNVFLKLEELKNRWIWDVYAIHLYTWRASLFVQKKSIEEKLFLVRRFRLMKFLILNCPMVYVEPPGSLWYDYLKEMKMLLMLKLTKLSSISLSFHGKYGQRSEAGLMLIKLDFVMLIWSIVNLVHS